MNMEEKEMKALNDEEIKEVSGGLSADSSVSAVQAYECPKCHSTDISSKVLFVSSTSVTWQKSCNSCGHKWIYRSQVSVPNPNKK